MEIVKFESSYIEPYPLQVEGESYYFRNIENISGYLEDEEDEGVDADGFTAHLILEGGGSPDVISVRVEIEGKTVGHLSPSAAKLYRKKLKELNLQDVIGECDASIRGGFIRSDGGRAQFGVRLDIALKELRIQSESPHGSVVAALNQDVQKSQNTHVAEKAEIEAKIEPITLPKKTVLPQSAHSKRKMSEKTIFAIALVVISILIICGFCLFSIFSGLIDML